MESLDLETYLTEYSEKRSIIGPVETLEVSYWHSASWWDHHTQALAKICHLLKVRILSFVYQKSDDDRRQLFFGLLTGHTDVFNTPECPFLPDLREIKTTYTNQILRYVDRVPAPMWTIFKKAQVRRLTFSILSIGENWGAGTDWGAGNWEKYEILKEVDSICSCSSLYEICNNPILYDHENWRSFRELFFHLPWFPEPIPFALAKPFNAHPFHIKLVETLEKNKTNFRKCLGAIVVVLGLKRRRQFSQNRDILGVIASMIWERRFTAWDGQPSISDQ